MGKEARQSSEVFIDANSTQIFQRTRNEAEEVVKREWHTKENASMPRDFLENLHDNLPEGYRDYFHRRICFIADRAKETPKAALIVDMNGVMDKYLETQKAAKDKTH